jgi:hypothetical protein
MSFNPPGHMPGVHIPGTLTPIGAVVQQQAAEEQRRAARRRKAKNLFLLLSD